MDCPYLTGTILFSSTMEKFAPLVTTNEHTERRTNETPYSAFFLDRIRMHPKNLHIRCKGMKSRASLL